MEEKLIQSLRDFLQEHGNEEVFGQLSDILKTEWMLEKLWDWDFDGEMRDWMIKKLKVEDYLDVKGS